MVEGLSDLEPGRFLEHFNWEHTAVQILERVALMSKASGTSLQVVIRAYTYHETWSQGN